MLVVADRAAIGLRALRHERTRHQQGGPSGGGNCRKADCHPEQFDALAILHCGLILIRLFCPSQSPLTTFYLLVRSQVGRRGQPHSPTHRRTDPKLGVAVYERHHASEPTSDTVWSAIRASGVPYRTHTEPEYDGTLAAAEAP